MTRSGFKRYITQSRRAIFFARYEASQTGSGFIEPEHLLLGILRSDEDLAIRLFKTKENIESIVRQVRATFSFRRKVLISGDLLLSLECKKMLAYGAEEAERRNARQIEPQHLLLGLLRDERCATAKIMLEHGVVPSFLENRSDQS
jgi:ATP-dependent Clp protease ATP-binding subunit ClpC